jgi:hypothetical protein
MAGFEVIIYGRFWVIAKAHIAMNGISEREILGQTGHRSPEILAKYIRIGGIFTRNAAAGFGI